MKKRRLSILLVIVLISTFVVSPISVFAQESIESETESLETEEDIAIEKEVENSNIDEGDEVSEDETIEEIPEGMKEMAGEDGLSACSVQTKAAGNSMASATNISTGRTYNGYITDSNKADYYKFTIASSGRITLTASAGMKRVEYYIYDNAGQQLWGISPNWNSTTEISSTNETIDLTKGTYYFVVERYYNSTEYTGNYSFRLQFSSANESFTETEGGTDNSMTDANVISLDANYKGQLAKNDDKDFYKFTMASSGRVTLTASAGMKRVEYYIYDNAGQQLWGISPNWNSTTEISSTNETIDLTKGTYYFTVERYYNSAEYTGYYSFHLQFSGSDESFTETEGGTDNSMADANDISLNRIYKGQIAKNDDKDFYKFAVNSADSISIVLEADMRRINYSIYDRFGEEVWSKSGYWNDTTKKINISEKKDLSPGTYYFVVERYYNSAEYTGNYSFRLQSPNSGGDITQPDEEPGKDPDEEPGNNPDEEPGNEPGKEQNDLFNNAKTITLNRTYEGEITSNKDKDCYKFTISKASLISVASEADVQELDYYIYNSSGKTVWRKAAYWNSVTKKINISETVNLPSGTYYFVINGNSSYPGLYTFGIQRYISLSSAKVSLSDTNYVYDGTYREPYVTVKSGSSTLKEGTDYLVSYSGNKDVGVAKVTITGKGSYNGNVVRTFTIKPVGTFLSKVTAKSKGFKVNWNRQAVQTSGYQIQYSTKSNFASKKTKTIANGRKASLTVKKLKAKKKYYVRVRTYKVVSGGKLYSEWSRVKKVKTKK